jgi:ectoine hydroxylase-related dioxygenase (phytanoyl-CoA dioxygenase family)
MDIRHREPGGSSMIGPSPLARLRAHGYCIIPNLLTAADIETLNADLGPRFDATPFCKGDFYGASTKRFGSILKRSPAAQQMVMHPVILSLVRSILGPHCDDVLLNLTQAIEIHPGESEQVPHRDQDMWGGPKGSMEYLVNVMWPLTPFTKSNGATVVWPGSHRQQDVPMMPAENAIAAAMNPRSALVFLGSTLHAGGANRTSLPRRGIVISYCLGWLRSCEVQTLVYPPDVARNFPPELAALLGYRIHRPNLGNYEGQSPAILLDGPPAEYLPMEDAMRPEQAELIAQVKRAKESMAAVTAANGADVIAP